MGFSGFGVWFIKAQRHGGTVPFCGYRAKEDDLEFPDKEASDRAMDTLEKILGFH